ncbi:hypothetical protein AVEN_63741-1 [Araneus ventricosus]|uniref:Uncharacterized protein n=1 Tax=Araneus ventricosus TaxID=182803 RepID=A0A4Y2P678_ARAVE|nr:hypothetical protein AVEN_63741-1 [Araneus ventricosus]
MLNPFVNVCMEIPMRIGVDLGKIWNSKVVGFPFILFGYKNEMRFFEAGDKSPVCVCVCGRERWGGGMCVGIRLEKSERGGKDALTKKPKYLFWGRGRVGGVGRDRSSR